MKTHVEFAHPKLFAHKKLANTKERFVVVASHSRQSKKK